MTMRKPRANSYRNEPESLEALLQVAAAEGGGEQVAVRGVLLPLHLQDGPPVHGLELPLVVLAREDGVLEGALDIVVGGL